MREGWGPYQGQGWGIEVWKVNLVRVQDFASAEPPASSMGLCLKGSGHHLDQGRCRQSGFWGRWVPGVQAQLGSSSSPNPVAKAPPPPEPYFRVVSPRQMRGTRLKETAEPARGGRGAVGWQSLGTDFLPRAREVSGVGGVRVCQTCLNLGFSSCFFCLFSMPA